jgi:hypothetical protein
MGMIFFISYKDKAKAKNLISIKMILLVVKWLPKQVSAMALFPFLLFQHSHLKYNRVLLNHERIHLRQQLELLVLPFYIWYLLEYVVRLLQYHNHRQAYLNISFEREAYQNEKDLHYLKQRSFASFLKYI